MWTPPILFIARSYQCVVGERHLLEKSKPERSERLFIMNQNCRSEGSNWERCVQVLSETSKTIRIWKPENIHLTPTRMNK